MVKNRVRITVDGKSFMLVGEESEAHMQQVAEYIDSKMKEIRQKTAAVSIDSSLAYVLTSLNVADDYFKLKVRCAELEQKNTEISAGMQITVGESEPLQETLFADESVFTRQDVMQPDERIHVLEKQLAAAVRAKEEVESKLDEYMIASEQTPVYNNTARYTVKSKRNKK